MRLAVTGLVCCWVLIAGFGYADAVGHAEQERLALIDERLEVIQAEEQTLRAQWVPLNRAAAREKQLLLAQDEEIRAIQEEISRYLERVRDLQTELQQTLQARLSSPDDDQPDMHALERQIVALRAERQELLRERRLLQQHKGRMPTSDDQSRY